jgi:hypothetical protein
MGLISTKLSSSLGWKSNSSMMIKEADPKPIPEVDVEANARILELKEENSKNEVLFLSNSGCKKEGRLS